jgi:hypothetical protein
VEVEGVRCRRVDLESFGRAWPVDAVPLVIAPIPRARCRPPAAIVDARLTKRPLEDIVPPGTLRIALGPGHVAGDDCDAVVETLRGADLGRVIWQGNDARRHRPAGRRRRRRRSSASCARRAGDLAHRAARSATASRRGTASGEIDGEPVRAC